MSGTNPSVSANTSVTITATSPVTQSVISAVFAAVTSPAIPSSFEYSNTSGAIPAAVGPNSVLYVAPSTTGNVTIPVNYDYVLVDQTSSVSLSGGDVAATIIGDSFTYSGSATLVASGQGVANITDQSAGASLDFGDLSTVTAVGNGANQTIQLGDGGFGTITSNGAASTILAGAGSTTSIVAAGSHDVVSIGNGAAATVNLSGTDTIDIGTGAATPASGNSAPSVSVTSVNSLTGSFNTFNIAANAAGFATANVILQLGTSDTVNVLGGNDTVSGLTNDVVNNTNGALEFFGLASNSTVFGGFNRTTVFGGSGQVFDVGVGSVSSTGNIFVGGSGASTINAGSGGGAFFGGSHGDLYNIGTSTVQTFVGTGGNDTLNGTAGSVAPTIFAIGTEHLSLGSGAPAVTVVAFEGGPGAASVGGTVDASSTNGNNVFFTGYGSTGNETLIGSAATIGGAHDIFEVGSTSLGGAAASSVPANITIDNFHNGDAFFLIDFTAADNTAMDNAVTAANTSGGALAFKLSDGTQVTFVGNHPTAFNTAANAIY